MRCESHTPGSFCTTVLRTRDPQRAAAFYNTLGGWTVEPVAGSRQHSIDARPPRVARVFLNWEGWSGGAWWRCPAVSAGRGVA